MRDAVSIGFMLEVDSANSFPERMVQSKHFGWHKTRRRHGTKGIRNIGFDHHLDDVFFDWNPPFLLHPLSPPPTSARLTQPDQAFLRQGNFYADEIDMSEEALAWLRQLGLMWEAATKDAAKKGLQTKKKKNTSKWYSRVKKKPFIYGRQEL
jgi:hypothetical protein